MTQDFIFLAQALDNKSGDHIRSAGNSLSDGDTVSREKAVSAISTVIQKGKKVFDARGVQLTVDGHRFVLEVLANECDVAGRRAPIVCSGDYDMATENTTIESVLTELPRFASRIQRSIPPSGASDIRLAFDQLKKKYLSTRRMQLILIAGTLVALVVASFLTFKI